MHFLLTLQYLFPSQCRIWSLHGHGERRKPSHLPRYMCICSNTKIPLITNLRSWKLLPFVPEFMVWSLLPLQLTDGTEHEQQKRLPWEHRHWSSKPCRAHQCSQCSKGACRLPCKGHAFTTWNNPRELPYYPMEGFSVFSQCLPCSMKETCCWELSDLELAPPAGVASEETASQFKRCDFLWHLPSYLPVSCCTRKRFNGAEWNTFCLLLQDSKAWTITKRGKRKAKLWIQMNKLAGL